MICNSDVQKCSTPQSDVSVERSVVICTQSPIKYYPSDECTNSEKIIGTKETPALSSSYVYNSSCSSHEQHGISDADDDYKPESEPSTDSSNSENQQTKFIDNNESEVLSLWQYVVKYLSFYNFYRNMHANLEILKFWLAATLLYYFYKNYSYKSQFHM